MVFKSNNINEILEVFIFIKIMQLFLDSKVVEKKLNSSIKFSIFLQVRPPRAPASGPISALLRILFSLPEKP